MLTEDGYILSINRIPHGVQKSFRQGETLFEVFYCSGIRMSFQRLVYLYQGLVTALLSEADRRIVEAQMIDATIKG